MPVLSSPITLPHPLQNFAVLLTIAPQVGHGRDSGRGAPQFRQNSGFPATVVLHFGHFRLGVNGFPQLRQNSGFPTIGTWQCGQVLCPGIWVPQFTQNRVVDRTSAPHAGHLINFAVTELTVSIPVSGVVLLI
jgi:hypothetical protein